jgi:hypothetical protein
MAIDRNTLRARLALILLAALLLDGCALTLTREHPLLCRLDEQRLQRDALYFGLSRPDGGNVSDEEWRGFVDDTLTPAFPAGLSIIEAQGQWRGANGANVHQRSRQLIVLHPFDQASERAIAHVIATYRQRFAQESVLRERSVACVRM